MKTALRTWGALILLAAPAQADQGVSISGGYSFLRWLEERGGNVPLGFYLSVTGRRSRTIELDLGYHVDSGDPPSGLKPTRETLTGAVGLKSAAPEVERAALIGSLRREWRSAFLDLGSAAFTAWVEWPASAST